MVRELARKQSTNFPETAPVANPVFFRTYSRRTEKGRETWEQVRDRCVDGLVKLGQLTAAEAELITETMTHLKSLPAGRWLWVGGTQWLENPKNYSGAYNCTSTNVTDWRAFGLMMDLAMMGCGTGAVLEEKYIKQLPTLRNCLQVSIDGKIGTVLPEARSEETTVKINNPQAVRITIGDSRQGWVQSYQALLELASNEDLATEVKVIIDPSHVRPAGERLKGFGGVANPVKIPELYPRLAKILNQAQGRKLNAEECCLLIDEAAATVVAGNIRRCLPEYALVHTARGLVAIKEVKVGDLVQTPLGFRRVVDKFDQGIQDVREIETNGTYPQATENHRMAVLSSANGDYVWKQVGELESGDRLLHNTKILAGIPTQLPADETSLHPLQSRTAKAISIPDLNPDVAWLIGFTHGDGYVSLGRNKYNKPYGSINWATDAELAPLIEEKLDRALANFGVSATKQTEENENTVRFVCSSIRLTEYFFKNIKRPKEPIEIPDFILQGSVETRAAYLAGIIDSDGSVKNRPPQLVCTVYPQFARQIASVLSSLGIAGRIKKTIPQKLNWRTKYHVCLPALKGEYNKLIASHAVKGELKVGLKMYGFTLAGEMMREAYTYSEMQKMGFQGNRKVDSNYERYRVESEVEMDIPVTFKQLGQVFAVQTYDIEVEDAHCFYCDGYLTHNSAGIRQFDADSPLLKQNLWQPDAEGNWRIDPDRDALRMANHTRVYHQKPSLEDCVEAVRSQFYSGEGAIQYAPEAIARGNADLLDEPSKRKAFLEVYTEKGVEAARDWLKNQAPKMPKEEVEHRLQRYGLNPCVTAETWVHTENGAQQVKDLIGTQQSVYVNGELFSTTPEGFFYTGTKPVVKLTTEEGYTLRLTPNHKVLKVTANPPYFPPNRGDKGGLYTEWVAVEELQPRDRVMLHNHRDIRPWEGNGTFAEGLEMSLSTVKALVGDQSPLTSLATAVESRSPLTPLATAVESRSPLTPLAKGGTVQQVETGGYEFYQGFLQGLFSAKGSIEETDLGVWIKLTQNEDLSTVQRMLLRLGIVSRCVGKELIIAEDNIDVFQAIIGFHSLEKQSLLTDALTRKPSQERLERFTATVASIELDGIEAVYDCTVPGVHRFDANGLVAHNCGEIIGHNFHCVAGDTLLITRDGMDKIGNLVGQTVEIWNGKQWSRVVPVLTGRNRSLYRVSFSDGTYLDVTDQHRFFVKNRFAKAYKEVTTAELATALKTENYVLHTEPFTIQYDDGEFVEPTLAYTLGQLVGDGSICGYNDKPQLQLRLYGAKSYQKLVLAGRTSGTPRYYTETKTLPCLLYTGFDKDLTVEQVRELKYTAQPFENLASWNRDSILHFIAGLADADGSEVSSGGIRIYLSGYDRTYRVYLLLCKCGIRSSINLAAKAGSETNLGIRQKDLWYLQITDCVAIPCQRLDTSKGHKPKYKGKWQNIRACDPLEGLHDTFCFNEPEFHKGVFGGTLTGQCNLSEVHLNLIDPDNEKELRRAFQAGALSVAVLLNHQFQEPRYQYSRELDPIVGVSFTGLFDFFVHAIGVEWLRWWEEGRPNTEKGKRFKQVERAYLEKWREIVNETVGDYCDRNNIKRPNRCTTVQPSGTKSLLTGASPGWHPPKAVRFIRRVTFGKNDPVALACIDYGYNVIPSQSDKDESGNLLHDPFDPRCTEWLVEIPVAVSWADLEGADEIDISQFSVLAQFDFAMQVQKHYVTHNTSATLELREPEIEDLGKAIYEAIQNDEGYISAALLARFDAYQSFPRLPFEPVDEATYNRLMTEVEQRRTIEDFHTALLQYDVGEREEAGPTGCDSDKCMFPDQ
ncbi:ribonucleoside-triphosphate reductase, adenosylcobalamin-dependent [Dactylococcopsis salina]|uniref:Homing endonuclease n=1 Tax=Dactylococcopsis salina (strain PCC 8305) TaxID=13035 RepID=K9YW47_DACS8|nr:ribonucleoside-triphosphate reductase, adenosylcobalamin-dependent [Dactylococcopsis salina]AFZ51124.1 Homing endonuclease [Dactylococcopsis salina PCC 8305]